MESLTRFLDAQATSYAEAFAEISTGRKLGHWMWFIFPQIQGLGFSETSRYFGLKNLEETAAFYGHPVLGQRLLAISLELLRPENVTARLIFGSPDDMKLRSCMTLFAQLPNAGPVFEKILNQFFEGKPDLKTLEILRSQ